jgi:hypothetical protein
MVPRALLLSLVLASLSGSSSFGQKSVVASPNGVQEFPAILRTSVTAGKTPVGTKVQAELAMATLMSGTVIPKKAILSGEIIESAAKTKTEPSRLSIRIDSATWKNGSTALRLYLTSWYYPATTEAGQDLRYGPEQPASRTWNGAGEYPSENTRSYKPFPDGTSDNNQTVPDTPNSVTSQHRVPMKNVTVESGAGEGLVLVSRRSNLKLDRITTYVLATSDLLPRSNPASR